MRRFRTVENESLLDVLEREIKQAEAEKAQVRVTLAELEAQLHTKRNVAFELESLEEFCKTVRGRVGSMNLDERRVILRRLSARICVLRRQGGPHFGVRSVEWWYLRSCSIPFLGIPGIEQYDKEHSHSQVTYVTRNNKN